MKKIYVSAAWDDAQLVRDLYKQLRAHGWSITRPWADITADIDNKADLSHEAVVVHESIIQADVMLVICNNENYPYRGLTYEMGIAIALNKTIIMVNNLPAGCYTMENMALLHPNIEKYSTTMHALSRLLFNYI